VSGNGLKRNENAPLTKRSARPSSSYSGPRPSRWLVAGAQAAYAALVALSFHSFPVVLLATVLLLGCPSSAPDPTGSDSIARAQDHPAATETPADGRSGPCPQDMVLLPAAEALLGTREPAEPWMGQLRRVAVPAFCMDVYEHPNQQGSLPTTSLPWGESESLCRRAGKRLCTADEWERACRGTAGRRFGYGEEFRRDICNTPLTMGGPVDGELAPLAVSGSHSDCHTPEGIFDLDGNVSEYVSDPWDAGRYGDQTAGLSVATFRHDPTVYHFSKDIDGLTHAWHTVRGGTMWTATSYGHTCLARHGHPDGSSGRDDGFRCCSNPRGQRP